MKTYLSEIIDISDKLCEVINFLERAKITTVNLSRSYFGRRAENVAETSLITLYNDGRIQNDIIFDYICNALEKAQALSNEVERVVCKTLEGKEND